MSGKTDSRFSEKAIHVKTVKNAVNTNSARAEPITHGILTKTDLTCVSGMYCSDESKLPLKQNISPGYQRDDSGALNLLISIKENIDISPGKINLVIREIVSQIN